MAIPAQAGGPRVARNGLDPRLRVNDAVAAFADVPALVRSLSFDDLPDDVVASARRSLLDLIGIAAAASGTEVARIAKAYATTELCGSEHQARILFDGRRAGIAGAAFAGATTID